MSLKLLTILTTVLTVATAEESILQGEAPLVYKEGLDVRIAWNRTHPEINYQVLILDGEGNYEEHTSICNAGDKNTTLIINYCDIQMKQLRNEPLSLEVGAKIKAKVVSTYNGEILTSDANSEGILVQSEPTKAPVLVRNPDTSDESIIINWLTLAPPEDGLSDIILYKLEQDKGSNGTTWEDNPVLMKNELETKQLNFTLADILSGEDYQFRIRAENEFGWGNFSEPITIKAAGVPHKALAPNTTIDEETGDVFVTWVAPYNHGEPITSFRIEVADSIQDSWIVSEHCPGTDVTVLNCTIPMELFWSDSYDYEVGQIAQIRLSAANSYGFGKTSDPIKDGATVRNVPAQMDELTLVSIIDDLVVLAREELTGVDTGNSEIIDYTLFIENEGKVSEFPNFTSENPFQVEGLSFGQTYLISMAANNRYGMGEPSEAFTYYFSAFPEAPGAPVVAVEGDLVVISWEEPEDNDYPITAYELKFDQATENPLICQESPEEVAFYQTCSINMLDIQTYTDTPIGEPIQISVRAENDEGWGPYSESNIDGPVVNFIPQVMQAPVAEPLTSIGRIELAWAAQDFPENGGSPIISYNLKIANETGEYNVIGHDGKEFLGTNFTIDRGLVQGSTYTFRVRSANIWGWSEFSETVSVYIPYAVPLQMSPPNEDMNDVSNRIDLSWNKFTNQTEFEESFEIIAYDIQMIQNETWADLKQQGSQSRSMSVYDLKAGQAYTFRIRAVNENGNGPWSQNITHTADREPSQAFPPFVKLNGTNIEFSWVEPYNHGDPITEYEVTITDEDRETIDEPVCSGINALNCTIPMSILREERYNLTQGQVIRGRVRSKNSNGWSTLSSVVEFQPEDLPLMEYPPMMMTTLQRGNETNSLQVQVRWEEPTGNFTGGSNITGYELQYDIGTNMTNLTEISLNETELSTIISDGIVPDQTYNFSIRAQNIHGSSEWSNVVVIKAAPLLSEVDLPMTWVDSETGDVRLEWSTDNGHANALEYFPEIANATGDGWIRSDDNCEESEEGEASLNCTISMDALTEPPYNYKFGDIISARISANKTTGPEPVTEATTSGA